MIKGRGRRPKSGSGPRMLLIVSALLALVFLLAASLACGQPVAATDNEPDWVEARLDAYATLFNITPEGREVIASLDVRRMEGQPAWYGSTGYRGFTGMGQARPDIVAHELGHAYWGAFPVTGHPELSWEVAEGETIPSAMARYHEDLRRFMLQPPDRYEPLRERFRNFPNLNQGRLPDLIHVGEADIPRLTAGDLGLVPPILRKYFDQYMSDGGYGTWADLMGWYAGLYPEDKRLTDGYLQIAHIPRDAYSGVGRGEGSGLDEELRGILVGEERQRLIDFVEQFDLVLGDDDSLRDAVNVDRGFPFWRSYLREMFAIHKRHPDLVEEYESAGTEDSIAAAFEVLESAMEREHGEAVEYLAKQLEEDSFLYNFLPILDNRLLLAVLGPEEEDVAPHALPKGAEAFVEELRHFIGDVESILEAGEGDPGAGARALEQHVRSLGLSDPTKLQQNVDTILELLFSTDRQAAEAILERISDEAVVDFLKLSPAQARQRLRPAKLVDALGIKEDAGSGEFTEGLRTLFENSSGNFVIDRAANEEAYERVAARGSSDPEGVLEIIREVRPRVSEFIAYKPEEALEILASDIETTLDLVLESGPVRVPPARLIYWISYFDADFTAEIVSGLRARGEDEVVYESVAYFAYDLERSREYPNQRISLERDGEFLLGLLKRNGAWRLSRMMNGAIEKYRIEVLMGNVDDDFLNAYRETLREAVSTVSGARDRVLLERVIGEAFGVGRPHL